MLQHNAAYRASMDLEHRFIVKDLLCGIVPLASIGAELGVETPIMNAFIEIGSVVCGRDFRAQGAGLQKNWDYIRGENTGTNSSTDPLTVFIPAVSADPAE